MTEVWNAWDIVSGRGPKYEKISYPWTAGMIEY